MLIILVILYYIICIIFEVNVLRKYYITPSFLFVFMQMVMFTGVLTYADFSNSSDKKLIIIYVIAIIMFMIGTAFSAKTSTANIRNLSIVEPNKEKLSQYQICVLIAMLIASLLMCAWFFSKAGYNVFLQILASLRSGGNNFTESRIALNEMTGVGYIYQFRVVILPLLCAFLITYKYNRKLQLLGYLVLPLMLIFVLGTGQRGGFVMFVLMWLVALVYVYKLYQEETVKKALIILVISAVVIFGIMTIFNGRVADNSNVFRAVLKRVFDDNQECAVVAFRYIDSQPIQWGKDWYLSIKDVFPGKNEYLQLSYVVFSIMYGSTRGTAPPCIWGSTYYNWGIIGIIVFPFILGFLYHRLYCKFINKPVSKLRIFIFSAMFVVLGNWIADTPLVLFNQGFITLCIMKFLLVPDVILTIRGRPLNK